MKQPVRRGILRCPSCCILLLALLLTLVTEALNLLCPSAGARVFLRLLQRHSWAFLTNFLLIALTLLPALFFKRRVFYCSFVSFLWLLIGGINGFIRHKRQTPFTAPDIAEVQAGLDTLPNYLPVFAIVLLGVLLLLLLAGLVLLFLRAPKSAAGRKRRLLSGSAAMAATALALALCWSQGFRTNQLSDQFSNLTYAYNDYGFAYCFLQTLLNRGIHRPAGYGSAQMARIEDALSKQADTDAPKVNLIVVQLESLLDPQQVEGLTLSQDAMPNLHRLAQEYSGGLLTVPVIGAGTANTEFEVLTGMRCRFFGPGEYPYKSRAQRMQIESAASVLGSLGYRTHAIHNHRATFYGRDTVYSNLGFDDFTPVEYMPEMPRTPTGWATDGVLTDQILQALDQSPDAADFVFTVTVQCHGSYPTDALEDPAIRVTACPDNLDAGAVTYYVNQLADTDAFVGDLIKQLEARGEPTVAVFYGDHLPSLKLTAGQMQCASLYKTNYVIWDNLGLAREQTELGAYQLTAHVLQRLGIHGGLMSRFHQACSGSSSYQADLRALEYDLLYGRGYLQSEQILTKAPHLQFGLREATITNLVSDDDDGCFYVFGSGFTPYCHVAQDGKLLDTSYMTDGALRVDADLSETDLDSLSIQVIGEHHELLGEIYD